MVFSDLFTTNMRDRFSLEVLQTVEEMGIKVVIYYSPVVVQTVDFFKMNLYIVYT